MKPDDVRQLYDAAYARTYDAKFLTSPLAAPVTECNLALLRKLIAPETNWLDVACGTGYFLRQFPEIARMGADLSPAMLELARENNPGVAFREHDFRKEQPEWVGKFSLVSSMWYAYTLVDTIAEVCQVVRNLASWTAPGGTCFVPLADPRLISRRDLPYHVDDNFDGQTIVTGILWSYVEDGGAKVHSHLVAPQVEFMAEQFRPYFDRVEIVRHVSPSGLEDKPPVLIAAGKRAA